MNIDLNQFGPWGVLIGVIVAALTTWLKLRSGNSSTPSQPTPAPAPAPKPDTPDKSSHPKLDEILKWLKSLSPLLNILPNLIKDKVSDSGNGVSMMLPDQPKTMLFVAADGPHVALLQEDGSYDLKKLPVIKTDAK